MASLPRVLRDIESLGHEVAVLKNQMKSVRQDIEKVMDSGDIDAIASKLVALQNCLGILTHVPDYEDRVAHLEGLKVRLEALASPHIVAAFTQHNLDESVKYARLLRSLGRVDQLESYYHKCEIGQEVLYQSQRAVVQAIYSPLQEQVLKYQEYEEALLLSHLISADIVKNDMAETLRRLREYCSKLSSQAEVAADRCLQLTNGWTFPSLVFALATYIEQFTSRLAQTVRHVEKQKTSIEDDWNVFTTCLNLIQAAGELVMAVDNMEHSLATMFTNAAAKFMWEPATPFTATPDLLLSKQGVDSLKQLVVKVVDEDGRLLENSMTQSQAQCQSTVEVALHTIMNPVSSQLASLPDLPAWNSRQGTTSHLSLSFSPQEYVTQIGQYLMTLPQHLEPLLVNHSPALNRALQEANTTCSTGPSGRVVSESEVSAADFLINSVGQNTCKLYTDAILKIPEITTSMITQLTTDIDYICNILEDLGVTSCDPLDKLNLLLKAPVEQYWKIAPGNNPRLIAAVRQMRNIPVQS
ncbi:putative conserved oligomeric Golgi complex subunit 7 [Penaeus vannamei]|uniref:Conserved oligomeric Golgi complex subunit 7 n=1 Tax=Penaeus vannamei TaxID=6689 RepID=A0A423TIY9_PENVA|nr:putative conserved oligomeric Golgi complex subunit 7 [Penaeus vannamei]